MDNKGWIVAMALLVAGTAQATCYSVHKADGSLVLETSSAPVNLTLPFGDTVPEKFGQGAFMVMSDSRVFCKERRVVQESQEVEAAAPMKTAAVDVADEHQATDEELLALKPEVVEPTLPVQVKAQQQMGAGEVAARVE
jgi:hypothetical protein